jgi:hypothetical protein
MSRGRSLRRLWRSPYVFAAAALLFASGLAAGGSTLASFNAQTENPATAAAGWLGSPSDLTATVSLTSGYNGELVWAPATHGLDGQQLWGYDNRITASCTTPTTTLTGAISSGATSISVASYASFPASGTFSIQVDDEQMTVTAGAGTGTWTVTRGANSTTAASHAAGAPVTLGALLETIGSATANTVSDSSTQLDSPRSGVNGHYACYRIVSVRSGATNWTATSATASDLLGLYPTGVSIAQAGTYFNDTSGAASVTITYNQNITWSGGATTFDVCLNAGPPFTLTLGSSGSCTAGIGTFSGGSDAGKTYTCTGSTASASGNTLVVSVLGCSGGNGGRGVLSGSATYTGAGTSVESTSGSIPQCTTAPCQLAHTYP